MRIILSLFDYSGAWSKPYADANYKTFCVDIKRDPSIDILTIDRDFIEEIGPVHGILAAPPCTDFSVSGAQYWHAKDADGRTAMSVSLVRKTLEIIEWANPTWWALENPVGRLNKLIPELAPFGPFYWQPHHYGDPYTKKTGLWGTFNRNLPRRDVEPVKVCLQGSWLMRLGGKSEKTKEMRSMTPAGFAQSFFEANP